MYRKKNNADEMLTETQQEITNYNNLRLSWQSS